MSAACHLITPKAIMGWQCGVFFLAENWEVCRYMASRPISTVVEAAADRYATLLPEVIDVLLLSMGEDGHIVSLFSDSAALRETLEEWGWSLCTSRHFSA